MAWPEVTVEDMAGARERRARTQLELLTEYPGSTLVCLTMNVAGPVKCDDEICRAFNWADREILAVLDPYKQHHAHTYLWKTGVEGYYCVEGDPKEIKRRMCALEDGCALGRLLDIDVLYGWTQKVSRTEIGLPARKCLLCGEDAPVCARSRKHTVQALFAQTKEIIRTHFEAEFAQRVGEMAQRALLTEVAVSPKPGLVDRENTGAHKDMDIFTFVDSACALRTYFEACAAIGMAHRGALPQDCFDALRVPGLRAEGAMKRATRRVNTHKGAIFSLGIFCAALGMGFDGETSDVQAAFIRCGEMTRAQMETELARLKAAKAKTFGEELYQRTGLGGVRAEAAAGFPCVSETGLPRLEQCLKAGMTINDAALCALVAMMARADDTNALRRGGLEEAQRLKETALQMNGAITAGLEAGRAKRMGLRSALRRWNSELTKKRISPGGSADMLALALLAYFIKER